MEFLLLELNKEPFYNQIRYGFALWEVYVININAVSFRVGIPFALNEILRKRCLPPTPIVLW